MLGNYKAPQTGFPRAKVVMLQSQDTYDCEALCGVQYPWLSDQGARTDAIAAWGKLVGQDVQVLDIPGNHFEAFTAQNVSHAFRSRLVILQSRRQH